VGKKVCLSRKIFPSRVTGFVFVTADDDYVVVNIRIYCVPSDLFFFLVNKRNSENHREESGGGMGASLASGDVLRSFI